MLHLAPCSKEDFDQIVGDVSDFWDSDRTLDLHHPMFVHEFGNSAFVVKEQDMVTAYLFGFLSQTETTGYFTLWQSDEPIPEEGSLGNSTVISALSLGRTTAKL